MRRFLFMALLAVLSAPLSRAGSEIRTESIQSTVLGTEVKYNVYLPDGWNTSGKTYPVIYLLHGLSGNYTNWAERGSVKMIADELIASGESCEVVIIMPNAGGKPREKVWNGYFNMPGWNYEDFFFGELMPAVEKEYRIQPDKGHRAIMGLSMGGGGSTVYCQRHPDMFSSCYAMSAWLDCDPVDAKDYDSPENRLYIVRKSVHENSALAFMEAADKATIKELSTISWFFDCGDDDSLLPLSVRLHIAMKKAKLRSELRVRNGVHNWEYWHGCLRNAIPFAARNFEK